MVCGGGAAPMDIDMDVAGRSRWKACMFSAVVRRMLQAPEAGAHQDAIR
jgi:hypothetical protein